MEKKLTINELKKQGYVNNGDTKYTDLPAKYFNLYYVLKDEKKKWVWADKMMGGKGKITPKSLYELCRKNPIAYVVFMKGSVPYPHQILGLEMLNKHKYVAICFGRRMGKEQPDSSLVLTPKGFTQIKNLRIGDTVITPSNKESRVDDIFIQGKKDVYELFFDDGTSVRCGLEHLWKYYTRRQITYNKQNNLDNHYVKEFKNILDYYKKDGDDWVMTKNNYVGIPLTSPIDFKKQKINIDAYLFGALLGDGCFRGNHVGFTTADKEMFDYFKIDDGYHIKQKKEKYEYAVVRDTSRPNKYIQMLRDYKLWDKKSIDKFVPSNYLYNTKEIRLDMLKGLMDTDGSINKSGSIEYCTVSKQLAKDVKFMVESLGGKCKTKFYKNDFAGKYRLSIRININIFKLNRKVKRYETLYNGRDKYRYIRRIKKVEKEHSRCLLIDDKDHLYLTDNFTVTHNSYMIKWFCDWACRMNRVPVGKTGTTFSIMMQNKENGKEVYMEKAYLEQMDGDLEVYKNFQGMLGDSFFSGALVKSSEKYGQVTGYKFTYNTLEDMSFDNYYKYINSDKKGKKMFRVVPSTFKIITSPRGLEGNVACDEISHWKKNPHLSKTTEVYEKEVEPIVTIQKELKCFMLTTPDGYDDIFEEKFNPLGNHETEYERLWFPCWVHQTDPEYIKFMKKKKEIMAKNGKLTTFQQEYEAMFVRGDDGFFDEQLHVERFFDDTLSLEPTSTEPCYISVDWGGTNTSHSVISVVTIPESNKDIGIVRHIHEYRINEDGNIVNEIIDFTHKFKNYRKVICDNKGGRYQVQQLQQMLGLHKVEAFNFTTQKRDGYNALKSLIVKEQIKCPENKRVREQMRNFMDTLKPANKVISDDVLDTIMMPCYYMKFDEDNRYDVLQYPEEEDTRDMSSYQ